MEKEYATIEMDLDTMVSGYMIITMEKVYFILHLTKCSMDNGNLGI